MSVKYILICIRASFITYKCRWARKKWMESVQPWKYLYSTGNLVTALTKILRTPKRYNRQILL